MIKSLVFGRFMSPGGRKIRLLYAKPNAEDLALVIRLVEEGKLNPVIDRRYPLARTAEAVRYQSEGHATGKIIIEVA